MRDCFEVSSQVPRGILSFMNFIWMDYDDVELWIIIDDVMFGFRTSNLVSAEVRSIIV